MTQLEQLADLSAKLADALEMMVRAFNVEDIDPLVAFASIEKAKAVLEKARQPE